MINNYLCFFLIIKDERFNDRDIRINVFPECFCAWILRNFIVDNKDYKLNDIKTTLVKNIWQCLYYLYKRSVPIYGLVRMSLSVAI